MAIKYEIHYLPNAGGEGKTRRFAHIFEEPAMKDQQVIERLAKHSCMGEGEVSAVLMNLRHMIEEDSEMAGESTSLASATSHSPPTSTWMS